MEPAGAVEAEVEAEAWEVRRLTGVALGWLSSVRLVMNFQVSLVTEAVAEAASVLGRKSCPGGGLKNVGGFSVEAGRGFPTEIPPRKQEAEAEREIVEDNERQMAEGFLKYTAKYSKTALKTVHYQPMELER